MGIVLIVVAVAVLAAAVYLATRERDAHRHKRHGPHPDSVIHCPHCGEHVSTYELTCPYCEQPIER